MQRGCHAEPQQMPVQHHYRQSLWLVLQDFQQLMEEEGVKPKRTSMMKEKPVNAASQSQSRSSKYVTGVCMEKQGTALQGPHALLTHSGQLVVHCQAST